MKIIAIAADHAGYRLKEKLKPYLVKKGLAVKDLGTYSTQRCDYPEFAAKLAKAVAQKRYGRGILICKSGIGSSIVANRFPGVRAALCYNQIAARLSREHNDSNVLVLGSAFVSAGLAKRILSIWLKSAFLSGRHQRRLHKIQNIEQAFLMRGKR